MNQQQILRKVDYFSEVCSHDAAFKALHQYIRTEKFSIGHQLLIEGQDGDDFYVLIEGVVSIYKTNPEGLRVKVAILNANSFPALGEGALILNEPRTATAIADSEIVCLSLNRNDFQQFSNQHPEWAIRVVQKIAQTLALRLKQANNDILLLHRALTHEIRGI